MPAEQAAGVNGLSTLNAVREAVVWSISSAVVIYIMLYRPIRRRTLRQRESTAGNREKKTGHVGYRRRRRFSRSASRQLPQ